MLGKVKKIAFLFKVSFVIMILAVKPVYAQEITAIDFNGDLIGKVIPDGTVISFDNAILGNVTADSFIVNTKGELIGGVIPQGIAIGNDNKLLGRVNNDGSVRLPSGKMVGKVLPNALVVDDSYNILGSVLYPGLIYDDNGRTVGRLTGDGAYISLEGQNIGFVSPLGYAYRNTGNGFVLDGKLISSKMVVSPDGNFIGSVTPGGRVTDFNSKAIGFVHANGYVYDENGRIVGKTVSNSYAFDNLGKYLGLVAYNGEVVNEGKTVARLRADNKVVDEDGSVIGFVLDIAATATDLQGRYLGRLMPDGKIVKARETVGTVGARGFVKNVDGEIIGQIVQSGPVFDYLGNLVAQALRNGTVLSTTGTPLGYVKGSFAYDNIGRLFGAGMDNRLIFDNSNNLLGLSGIGSDFTNNSLKLKISPFGYVYSADNLLTGHTVSLDALYGQSGKTEGYAGADGNLQGIPQERNYKLTQFGNVINSENTVMAAGINPFFAIAEGAKNLFFAENNLLMNEKQEVTAKILPEYKIVTSSQKINNNVMPVIGSAGTSPLAVGINGNMLGYVDFNGIVRDYSGNRIGSMLDGETVADTNNAIIGKTIDFKGVVNDECTFLGVIGTKGEIRNSRDVILGKILTNGQAISEVGNVIGFGITPGNITDFEGKSLGNVNTVGRVLNYAQENLGCIRRDGRFYNNDNHFVGSLVQPAPVMNFENMLIGRSDLNSRLVNDKSETIGYIRPDGTAVSDEGEVLGTSFRYKVAFDNENSFLGRVIENGNVVSNKNDVLGQVQFDGTVVADNKPIGYALYDFYIYDENGQTIGYLTRDGMVSNFSGGRLGKADKGFLVDKNYVLIGRGNRDYFIRDEENQVIGELMLNGEVINTEGTVVGNITGSGEIRDAEENILATARELQYYNVHKPEPVKPADWATPPTSQIKVDAVPTPQPEEAGEYGMKTIGIALTPDGNYLGDILANNDVIDKLGNLLGKKMPDGLIMDDDGNLIGIEEAKNVTGGQMFVPAGTFGSGGAYGTGTAPTNLGPGGGFGPGERYDPVRAQALAAAQAARRSEMTVGQLSTTVKREDFDGRQNYWEGVERRISTWPVDMSEMILADKPIPAVLARTIMSGSTGNVPVTAIVERNVYAEDGRNIVIPAGSRVMGESSGGSGGGSGSVRVSITWKRLIRPDGSAFEFSDAQTGDAQGKGGALGYVDEQLAKKYTLPIVTNLLSSAVAYVMADGESTTSSDGGTTEDNRAEAANDARENFLNNMDQMFQEILADKTNIEAVTYVPAGTRLIIYPKVDLWIRTPERSEEETLQDIEKPTVFIDDRKMAETGGGSNSSGGSAGGGNTTTGTSPGTSGVVYLDESGSDIKASTPLISDNTNNKKKTPASTAIPPVTSTGATPPPPSTTSGASNNTSAQLF